MFGPPFKPCHPLPVPVRRMDFGEHGPVVELWVNGDADPVIFYPGTMTEPGHYQLFINAVLASGLTLAGIHLSGHGLCAKTKRFSFADLLEQGLVVEAWLKEQGYSRMAVCGHSQGGILALAHAGASPALNAAFAISTVFPQQDEAIMLTRFAHLSRKRALLMTLIEKLAHIVPMMPVWLPVYLSIDKICAGSRAPLYLGKGKNRYSYPIIFLASLFGAVIPEKINCPFWLFNAADDALFCRELILKVFERIEAPRKKLIWLSGGGHLAPLNPCFANYIARSMACACVGAGFRVNAVMGEVQHEL